MRRAVGKEVAATLAALLAMGSISPGIANSAAANPNCLEQATEKISPGARLTITQADGSQLTGRLQFLDFREKLLTLELPQPADSGPTLHLRDISRIEYRTHPSFFKYSLLGGALGFVGGLIAISLVENDQSEDSVPNPESNEFPYGLIPVGGALAGFIAGTITAAATSVTETIDCPNGVRER